MLIQNIQLLLMRDNASIRAPLHHPGLPIQLDEFHNPAPIVLLHIRHTLRPMKQQSILVKIRE